MNEFSIELASEKIFDPRTREYFSEVLSSFINGNYRSAVVMLWSVVISDLIYKLQTLRDLYNDSVAKSILESIEAKQNNKPSSPEWESNLLNEIKSRTNLLDVADYQHLLNLQKLRHLSAHPVISETNLLFSPNKETTRALIRNALESVLLKPPIFTKKIVHEFVKDISEKKDLFPDEIALGRYLETKYFRNLHPAVEKELIKALWKFCFRLSNSDTDANREINTRALYLFYKRNPNKFSELIVEYNDYFSEIASRGPCLKALIYFLGLCPTVYDKLNDAAKTIIKNYVIKDVNLFISAVFLSDDLKDHISQLSNFGYLKLRQVTDSNWNKLINMTKELGLDQHVYEIGINVYCKSGSFDSADANFARFIEPYLAEFDKERVLLLLKGIEENNQTYWRGRAQADHKKIKKRIDSIGEIDLEKFPNFMSSLEE